MKNYTPKENHPKCCFSLKRGWLGPPLKLPPTSSKVAKRLSSSHVQGDPTFGLIESHKPACGSLSLGDF